jgi:protein-disulfide isomerase
MSETLGEHHAHHSSDKGNDFSHYVLPLSILLAAVIIGWSLMSAATTLGNGLDGLTIGGGTGTTVPTVPTPNDDTLAPAGPTQTMAELAVNGAGSIGSESAPVVIVEYSDYQCPFCRVWFNQSEEQLIQTYVDTGKVQFVYKDFPLSFHPMAAPSANAARCAGDQGKYWEYHDALYAEQNALNAQGGTVQYTLADIKAWGKKIGLNESTFNACVDADTYASEIAENMAEGQTVGVGGTPSFVIGLRNETGQLVVGAQPYSTFQAALDSLLN